MTHEEFKAELQQLGWRIDTDGHQHKRTGVEWWAWKILEGGADCSGNDKAPDVCIYPWRIDVNDHYINSVQFELAGGVRGDVWVQLMVYSVPLDRALQTLPRATEILLASWNAAAA